MSRAHRGMGWSTLWTILLVSTVGGSARSPQVERLDSWKKIASYLKREVRTVQRWERREAMPVHRHQHDKLGSVFAFRSELDAWWESRRTQLALEDTDPSEPPALIASTPNDVSGDSSPPAHRRFMWVGIAITGVLLAGALAWFADQTGYFWRSPLANAKFTRSLDFAGAEQAAAISRDGKCRSVSSGSRRDQSMHGSAR